MTVAASLAARFFVCCFMKSLVTVVKSVSDGLRD
jgi:hypothetical protein